MLDAGYLAPHPVSYLNYCPYRAHSDYVDRARLHSPELPGQDTLFEVDERPCRRA